MKSLLLSPKMDFIFKKIFGHNPDILISFLNAVIKPKNEIESVEIKNSDIEKEHIKDKFSRLDIKAVTNKKENINIEIQVKNEKDMIKRSLYYWSKLYEEQLLEGDIYDKLEKTICINILDFKYLETERFHNVYRLKEIETNEELTDIEEIHFIEIPKLRKLEEETKDLLEVWIEFLRNPESKTVIKVEETNKEIRKAKSELYRLSMDTNERELYYIREKAIKDELSALYNAREEGRKQGVKETSIKIAKSLLDKLDDKTISEITKLDLDIIKNLRN